MRSVTETRWLPFSDCRLDSRARQPDESSSDSWLLALRRAQAPSRANDNLMLLYGHPLVFRLGLYAVTDRVLVGEQVLYLDGANTFDPFVIGRLARAHRQQPHRLLTRVHVARAFTCHQMERLVSDCLSEAFSRYRAKVAVLSGLLETFYDESVPDREVGRLLERMAKSLRRLTQQGYTLLCLCPPAPVQNQNAQRFLNRLRGQADRVVRVEEEQGLVVLREEGRGPGQSWHIARAVLERR
jgi:hypothetical protein